MLKRIGVLGAPVALLALAGCHQSRTGVFAQGHNGVPNEFVVGRSAPLVIPPDFALVPPRPGAPRPQEADSSTQALGALFPPAVQPSAGEQALLGATGANPPVGIRSEAGSPGTEVVNKGQATQNILNAPAGTTSQTAAAVSPTTAAPATPPK
ncbi:hypothetical protein FHS31_002523 [Sphingomonas vulcanisoli]|uniref:DUF3035 domain-containing protein n=1 Tax=Sphingomonas vulcanisoli TaxID=1658060 RepID=A0ABX0TXJ8_9SPHN|nr:DUF3035 domain-containing protein [Sphingomonas vulcanisoli]NIJ08899.1 hypothetical protein [Sphingomonas vulcanisoli]